MGKKKSDNEKKVAEATSVVEQMARMSGLEEDAKLRLGKRILKILNTSAFEAAVGDLILVSITRMLVASGMAVTDPVIVRMYQDSARFKGYQADVHEEIKNLIKKK
jgi:ribosomal protein L14